MATQDELRDLANRQTADAADEAQRLRDEADRVEAEADKESRKADVDVDAEAQKRVIDNE